MIKYKKCAKCAQFKPLSEFYRSKRTKDGLYCYCKKCSNKRHSEYVEKNRDKLNVYMRARRSTPEGKLKAQESNKKCYEANKERYYRTQKARRQHLDANDPVYKRKMQLVRSLSYFMHRNAPWRSNWQMSCGLDQVVGCSMSYLKKYLFDTWEKEYGAPWDGEPYHIDHIIPLDTAKTITQVEKLFNYKNLRLITPTDNYSKGPRCQMQ